MTNSAKVIEIKDNLITLQMASGGGCSSSRMFKTRPHKFKLKIPKDKNPQIGDIAIIEINPKKSVLSSFILFIAPLIFFIPAYYIGLTLTNKSQERSALIGLIGIIIGSFITLLINKRFNNSFEPTIKEFTKGTISSGCQACKMNQDNSKKNQ